VKIHNEYAQGSLPWLLARAGKPTASEFDNLVTPGFELRTGEMPKSYMAVKLAEAWIGMPLEGFSSFPTEQGTLREERAIPAYTLEYGSKIEPVGFITSDDERIGCSPDGLFEDGTGIEIKCPQPATHVKYLLSGTLPKDYAAQVHGSMLVTGAPHWTFFSYCPRFPHLVLKIWRDEKVIGVLERALEQFLERFDEWWALLVELNGGELPPKPKPFVPIDNVDPRSLLFQGLPGEFDHHHITP
jgi:exodeoxyribonuclease (lambda-induced)